MACGPEIIVLIVDEDEDVRFFESLGFEVCHVADFRPAALLFAHQPTIAVLFAGVLKACLSDTALLRYFARLDTPLLILSGRASKDAKEEPLHAVLARQSRHLAT